MIHPKTNCNITQLQIQIAKVKVLQNLIASIVELSCIYILYYIIFSLVLFFYLLCMLVLLLLIRYSFSYLSMSSLSCVQRFFSKIKLVKTLVHTQLNQTNLENQPHNSTESLKEGILFFNILWMI